MSYVQRARIISYEANQSVNLIKITLHRKVRSWIDSISLHRLCNWRQKSLPIVMKIQKWNDNMNWWDVRQCCRQSRLGEIVVTHWPMRNSRNNKKDKNQREIYLKSFFCFYYQWLSKRIGRAYDDHRGVKSSVNIALTQNLLDKEK